MRGIRLALVSALFAALLSPAPGGARPVPMIAPRGAGVLASPNVTPLGSLPDVGATGGRFAGGYFFMTVSSPGFFEAGPNSGLRIYDYTIPEVPVLTGMLPLPHAENEDVDVSVSRKLVLISMDTISENARLGDKLYVVSWANPRVPLLTGVVDLPATVGRDAGGPGHIANCIADCKRYAWVTGARDGSIFVIDLADPAKPFIAGTIPQSARRTGGFIHDVNVDPRGTVWVTGSGGTEMLDARNPLRPRPLKWIAPYQNDAYNQFIHHNSLRLDATTVLITEEDWLQPGCGTQTVGAGAYRFGGGEQGGFQTWRINPKRNGVGAVWFMDQWLTELEHYARGSNPVTITCSSHWFTFNGNKIVAVGWYNQGVRFLDVSNPRAIRQVGYWLGPAATASAAYFVPGRDDIVYVTDYNRGFEVLRIADGGLNAPLVRAPLRAEWLAGPAPFEAAVTGEEFGYACRTRRR